MDVIAVHCDGYSLPASLTIRTARSMTSGEYLGCYFMAPFSQAMDPPQNPGRFKLLDEVKHQALLLVRVEFK
jgi:hypothetical protein